MLWKQSHCRVTYNTLGPISPFYLNDPDLIVFYLNAYYIGLTWVVYKTDSDAYDSSQTRYISSYLLFPSSTKFMFVFLNRLEVIAHPCWPADFKKAMMYPFSQVIVVRPSSTLITDVIWCNLHLTCSLPLFHISCVIAGKLWVVPWTHHFICLL